MSVVSLSSAKAYLNITGDQQDGELIDTIDRAEAVLARRVGPLGPEVVTDEVHSGPGPILLRRWPVVSLTSATSDGNAVLDLELDTDAGVVYGTFSRLARNVRVSYVAGRGTPLPADLEAAVLELVKHLWESQRVSRPGASRPGFGGSDLNPEVEMGAHYLLPYRVQTLIEPYLLPTVA